MNSKNLLAPLGLALLISSLGCLRNYNVSPLSPVSLNTALQNDPGLELKTKAFTSKAEVAEKFGHKLAEDREVLPIQVLITNKGTESFKVLRTSFQLVETGHTVELPALTSEEIYQLGREGFGAPVCGLIFGGPLGVPSLVTTIVANNRLRDDYQTKLLQEAILDPGKECSGAVFFNPEARNLKRSGTYKLVVDLLNAKTNAKVTLQQTIN